MVSIATSGSVTIARDTADVWAYVSDVTNQDHWVDGMSDSEIVGNGSIGRGTQIRGTYTYGGGSAPVLMTVTEFREGKRLAIDASEGPFPFSGLLSLEQAGGETVVTNSMTAGSDHIVTSIMFTLLRPVMEMMMGRQLRKELRQLKDILESGGVE
ncbi:MAG: SRPBCC family protein [Chloroflexi bacterium]|nr:SRPBCC family protein [Chloroflexota bacterium]